MSEQRLYQHLSDRLKQAVPESTDLWPRIRRQVAAHRPARRPVPRIAWALAAALALALALLIVSGQAQALLRLTLHYVGDLILIEADEYPYQSQYSTSQQLTEIQTPIPATVMAIAPLAEWETYQAHIPTHIPSGYHYLWEMSNVIDWESHAASAERAEAQIYWQNAEGSTIALRIITDSVYMDNVLKIGLNSLEQTEVNGIPAVWVFGYWDSHTKEWITTEGVVELLWKRDDLVYRLSWYPAMLLKDSSPYIKEAPLDELMQMAESIP